MKFNCNFIRHAWSLSSLLWLLLCICAAWMKTSQYSPILRYILNGSLMGLLLCDSSSAWGFFFLSQRLSWCEKKGEVAIYEYWSTFIELHTSKKYIFFKWKKFWSEFFSSFFSRCFRVDLVLELLVMKVC